MKTDVIRDLEGPFDQHVYIAYATEDGEDRRTVLDLQRSMQKRGLICFVRSPNCDNHTSIRDGVRRSRKCMIFLTDNYQKTKEGWFHIETEAILEKTERFSSDILVILKTESVQVPERLRGYKEISFKPKKLKDEKFMAQLVDIFLQEPSASLVVLPKQNMGHGSAFGYFYGFLRLTLPDFRKRLIEETLKNNQDWLPNTVKKMLIIMPESCFCPVGMNSPEKEEGKKIEFTEKYVVRVANRAGNVKRDYKSSLFKLTDRKNGTAYYFVGELATPLLTMYETYLNGLCGMTLDQLYAERDAFYFTLKAILSHPDNVHCNDQFRLLYWCDPESKKPNREQLYDFLLPVLKKELEVEGRNEHSVSQWENLIRVTPQISESKMTFEQVETSGSNPARIYESLDVYKMTRNPRGICLIVNIVNFNKGNAYLTPRKGGERDREILQKLFTDLHFEVMVHNDVDAQTLESLFLTIHLIDHTNYDAFVCCILTHGKLGVIYTSDGKPVEILELVEFITDKNCPSLKGKPKMFFIQACQSGQPGSVQEGSSRPMDDVQSDARGETGAPLHPSSDEKNGEKTSVSSPPKIIDKDKDKLLQGDAIGDTGAPAFSIASPHPKAVDVRDTIGFTGAPAGPRYHEDKDKKKAVESSPPETTHVGLGRDLESDAYGVTGATADLSSDKDKNKDKDKKKTVELSPPKATNAGQVGYLESDAVGITGAQTISSSDETKDKEKKKTGESSPPKATNAGQVGYLEGDEIVNIDAQTISSSEEARDKKKVGLNEKSPPKNPDAGHDKDLQSDAKGVTGVPPFSSLDENEISIVPVSQVFLIQSNLTSTSKKDKDDSANKAGSSFPQDNTTTITADVEDGMKKMEASQNAVEHVDVRVSSSETVGADAQSAPHISDLEEQTYFKHKAVLVPGSPDFLMSYSTLPGSISYRDTQLGSLYVQALDKWMKSEQEIDRVLKQVSQEVKADLEQRETDGNGGKFQLPFHLTTGMYRLIYL